MNIPFYALLLLLILALSGCSPAIEQQEDNIETNAVEPSSDNEDPSVAEILEESAQFGGLFDTYQDKNTGITRILLRPDQFNKTYLYFSYIENGVSGSGWLTKGSYPISTAKVFTIRRYFNRIEFIEENTKYYVDPTNPVSKAKNANISHAILFDQEIEAEDAETGSILIQTDDLFLSESLNFISPLPDSDKDPQKSFTLGSIDSAKSKIRKIKNYPGNTDVIVEYVFENLKPYVWDSPGVTDPRFVSIRVQHSLIEAPETPMSSRSDDPRVGYFFNKTTDLTSLNPAPYRDIIKRFRLEKTNPNAPLSDPVTPIVFWLENTTPFEFRPIITQAALRWNEAFEKAGFSNAIEVHIQPDDAEWDAGDIRYNVIRWVSSPQPHYSGYGPSFSDPRTGEILGADIVLEFSTLSYRINEFNIFSDPQKSTTHNGTYICDAIEYAKNEMLFARTALDAFELQDVETKRLIEEYLHFLTLHEIGHTLGLSHNFRASHLHSFEDIFNPEITYPVGLYASVMDYPAVPFRSPHLQNGQYYTTRPGPYDQWAIQIGYTPSLPDPSAEILRQNELLAQSSKPENAYGNDADDMRHPGKGIDPRAMIGDLTSDPIRFSAHQITLVKSIVPQLKEKLVNEGDSYQGLYNAYFTCLRRYRGALDVLSRYIGGVYVDRSVANQPDASSPLSVTPFSLQKDAMEILSAELFSIGAFTPFEPISNYLLEQRRGWDHEERTEDPKLHTIALNTQKRILSHLLHPRVLTRISDSTAYGNTYDLSQFFTDLTDTIFKSDIDTQVSSYRQNLQLEYLNRLLTITDSQDYDYLSQSIALNRILWIQEQLQQANKAIFSQSTKAHRAHLRYRIEESLYQNK